MFNDTLDRTTRKRRDQEEALLRAYMSTSAAPPTAWANAKTEVDALFSPRQIARSIKQTASDPVGSAKGSLAHYKNLATHPARTFKEGPIGAVSSLIPVGGLGAKAVQAAARPALIPDNPEVIGTPKPYWQERGRVAKHVRPVGKKSWNRDPSNAGSGYHGKTAVIVDIEGSTPLATEYGGLTHFVLSKHFIDTARPIFEKYGSERHQHIGDGYTGTFNDPRKAVQLAKELRDTLGTQAQHPYRISVRSDQHPGYSAAGGEIADRHLWRAADEQGKKARSYEVLVDDATLDGINQRRRTVKDRILGEDLQVQRRNDLLGLHTILPKKKRPHSGR